VAEIAQNMHVNFDYQVDPDGDSRAEVQFDVEELLQYRLGGLDVAVARLAGLRRRAVTPATPVRARTPISSTDAPSAAALVCERISCSAAQAGW